MKKINFKILIVTCIVTLLPIILGIMYYSKLPDQVAIHFDINNAPNGYFPKIAFVFGMPLMMCVLQIFSCLCSDFSDEHPDANKKALTVYKWIIPMITVILYIVTILYAIGSTIDIGKIVMCILGIVFVVIGNYVPKTIGISNYSLKWVNSMDEKIKKKINRILGHLFILNGMLFFVSTLFEPVVAASLVVIAILEIFIVYFYALVEQNKIKNDEKKSKK